MRRRLRTILSPDRFISLAAARARRTSSRTSAPPESAVRALPLLIIVRPFVRAPYAGEPVLPSMKRTLTTLKLVNAVI
jgi:hypothetical protein